MASNGERTVGSRRPSMLSPRTAPTASDRLQAWLEEAAPSSPEKEKSSERAGQG